jgi:predicted phage terminase large subunit-like protein
MVADLAGFRVKTERETGEKVIRADPFAAQWQAGNVEVLRAPWNENYFSELEAFPSAAVHDDQVDASSGAFNKLVKGTSIYDVDDDNE